MTEELVTFETAKLAREKGFDEVCDNVWMLTESGHRALDRIQPTKIMDSCMDLFRKYLNRPDDLFSQMNSMKALPIYNSRLAPHLFTRPTQDLLERWLREKHRLLPGQFVVQQEGKVVGFRACVVKMDAVDVTDQLSNTEYTSMELAREAALSHALKLLP